MKLLRPIVIALTFALGACASTSPIRHRVGAVNNIALPPCESGISLNSSTVFSATRLVMSIDTLGYDIVTTGTWVGSYGLQESNDNSTWIDVTLPSTPPSSTGSPQSFGLSYEGGWPWAYARVKFAGSSSTGAATVCLAMKG